MSCINNTDKHLINCLEYRIKKDKHVTNISNVLEGSKMIDFVVYKSIVNRPLNASKLQEMELRLVAGQ